MKKNILLLLFLPIIVSSQTIINAGYISGTWTKDGSPYLIKGTVTILKTDTLVIDPGVRVEFQNNYSFKVGGLLIAEGTLSDSILFTIKDTTGYHDHTHIGWKGITINTMNSLDSSRIKYCIIEYGRGNNGFGGCMYLSGANMLSITNTVIRNGVNTGGSYGSKGGGMAIIYSSPFLRDVVVQNNYTKNFGGGIYMYSCGGIDAERIVIKNNHANSDGGGLYLVGGGTLDNFTISDNTSIYGGGVYSNSDMRMINSEIFDNTASSGGGIMVFGSLKIINTHIHNNLANYGGGIRVYTVNGGNSTIDNCRIYNNHSDYYGGGLYISSLHEVLLKNSVIDSNFAEYGGGVYLSLSAAFLEGTSIKYNNASYGGGMYIRATNPSIFKMDTNNLCSIYSNYGKIGKDLYSTNPGIGIKVDTFSVFNPTDYYAIPSRYFSFNINQGLSTLINTDFYVSPTGSNHNSGQSSSDPFKTIDHALSVLYCDSLNPVTLYVDDGVYSPSNTGEVYPLTAIDNLTIQGSGNTIFDADSVDRIMYSYAANSQFNKNLTLKNGLTNEDGGGIYLKNSKANFDSINIKNCSAENGGGIFMNESSSVFSNTVLINNAANTNGGGLAVYGQDNQSDIVNTAISNNSAKIGGGIYSKGFTNFRNVSLVENKAEEYGGGIYCYSGTINFDSAFRSNIYLNKAPLGNDLYNFGDSIIHVIVDTFTVEIPTTFHALPFDRFDFDILNGKAVQIWGDIYISVDGDNNNSGLSWAAPLKTINHALMRSYSDNSNPITLHLASGTYSRENNGETLPIRPIGYCKLMGYEDVTLDADSLTNCIDIASLEQITIQNLVIQNGFADDGGGIRIIDSDALLSQLTLTNNTSDHNGGAIHLETSNVSLIDLVIRNNTSLGKVGGVNIEGANVSMRNVLIDNNQAIRYGGLSVEVSQLFATGIQVTRNRDNYSTGGIYLNYAEADFTNATVSGNSSLTELAAAIYGRDSVDLKLNNCIIFNNENEFDILINGNNYTSHLFVSNSSLTNGENSISMSGDVELTYLDSNIAGDPIFTGFGEYPYQINNYSSCIDVGTPDTTGLNLPEFDLAGEVRIFNGRVDMGAYEWNTFVGVEELEVQSSIFKVQIYPNPLTSSTTISYNLLQPTSVQITIFSHLGEEVEIIWKKQSQGKQQVIWNAEGLPAGMYYYKLQAAEQIASGKMVVIR